MQRLAGVRARIENACAKAGRPTSTVQLLPVTKSHPATAALLAAAAGLPSVGENRVQEAVDKQEAYAGLLSSGTVPQPPVAALRWELIGHLQSNKSAAAAAAFDRIQSVDSLKLVERLERAAAARPTPLPVLLQANAGRDPAKFGVELEEADALLEAALRAPHLRVEGWMTIAPLDASLEAARRAFAALRALRDRQARTFGVDLPELSMGMSGDLEPAIAEGSTLVRVGTALFGIR